LTDIIEKYTHKILILAEGIEQNVGILANFYDMGRVGRRMKLKSVYVVIFSKNLIVLTMVNLRSVGMIRIQSSSHHIHIEA
jgi:hypothetical protein